jgi:hypothetical protein
MSGTFNTYRSGRWCTRLDSAAWNENDMLQGWLDNGFPTGITWRLSGTEMALAKKLNIPLHKYAEMKSGIRDARGRRKFP